ncbi:PAS domain S-box protein [Planctomicrobium piriforme]|uniref:histidine kinase n=1 Tax=Planctomicrobium piriforme TaxID=1576369 RepID=A0A1I3RA18_9PLAN|nr:PAS domain S-box protein [Planctomicrobium piriforme]SFJ42900.1 PAS domain S-box-containing protein [Planctomicrobium piriforme]
MSTVSVLIVEDVVDDATLMLAELQGQNGDLVWQRVESAVELRSALASRTWDIVLSDYSIPGFDASAALQIVRTADPDLSFVVVSAAVGEVQTIALMQSGANDYLFKGNLKRLSAVVEREVRDTRQRRAHRAALQQVRRLASIVHSSSDGIVGLELDGTITSWNPAAEQISGWSAAEMVGTNLYQVTPEHVTALLRQALERIRTGQKVESFETTPLRKDGTQFTISLLVSPVLNEDHVVVGAAIVGRDFTEHHRQQSALQQGEVRYRTLIEAISEIVWTAPASGEVTDGLLGLPGWGVFTGQSAAEINGWGWLEAVHPEDREHTAKVWSAAIAQGGIYRVEHRLRRRDGVYRNTAVRGVPVLDNDGAILEWIGVHTDITEQKEVEQSLRNSEERFRTFMDNSPALAWVADVSGRVLYANATYRQSLQLPVSDPVGQSIFGLFPKEIAQIHLQSTLEVAASKRIVEVIEPGIRADGSQGEFLVYKFPIPHDGEEAAVGAMAIDVTGRNRAQKALLLRDRAIGATTQGILITDPTLDDNPIIYASPGFTRLTGYSADEAFGRNCRFLQGADTDPKSVNRLRKAVRAGEACHVEMVNYKKDGKSFWNELTITPLRDAEGQLTHFVGVQTDVTERRRMADQLREAQKMEAIGQLAGGVAHDFNNFLTVINGYSDLLLQRLFPDDPHREMVMQIRRAGEHSAHLTDQLLALGRKQMVAPRVVDVNRIVREGVRMLRGVLGEDIELKVHLASDLWPVWVDPGLLQQVLMNLAVNARDAMLVGGLLTIETSNLQLDEAFVRDHPESQLGKHVLLSVTDTGMGMSTETLQRVFEPFFTTKPPGKGTGLGLSVVHGIVRQAHGHVEIESSVGHGATVRIYFPSSQHAVDEHDYPIIPAVEIRGVETVLLVEDEPGVRALSQHILTSHGFQVLTASNGQEAIAVAAKYPGRIDLLVTDVVMPELGGGKLAEQLHRQRPEIRVLFTSGYADDAVVRHGVLHELVSFLPKPFTPLALALKAREVLDAPS